MRPYWHEAEQHRLRLIYTYAVTLCGGLAIFAFAGTLMPELSNLFLYEGGLLENLKLALFFSGTLVGLVTLLLYKRRRLATYYWLVPIFCLLGCFEEIGYGDHLSNSGAFPVVLGVSINSFHSLTCLAWAAWEHAGLGVVEAALVAGALAVAARPWLARHRRWIFSAFETNPSTTYLLLALVLLLPIIYVHNFAWNTPAFGLIERELELGLALTMLFAALAGPSTIEQPRLRRTAAASELAASRGASANLVIQTGNPPAQSAAKGEVSASPATLTLSSARAE